MTAPFEDLGPDQPTLVQVIRAAIEAALLDGHQGLPGRVLAFDDGAKTVDVQPTLKRAVLVEDEGPSLVSRPMISRVPVLYPAFGPWSIVGSLVPGDEVFLAFCDRSLDAWKEGQPGQDVDPRDTRRHDLSDAVAIPQLRRRRNPLPSAGDGLRIGNQDGSVVITLTPTGASIHAPQVLLEAGGDANQAFVRGQDLVAALQALTVPTAFGPSGPPLNAASFPPALSSTIRGR